MKERLLKLSQDYKVTVETLESKKDTLGKQKKMMARVNKL